MDTDSKEKSVNIQKPKDFKIIIQEEIDLHDNLILLFKSHNTKYTDFT